MLDRGWFGRLIARERVGGILAHRWKRIEKVLDGRQLVGFFVARLEVVLDRGCMSHCSRRGCCCQWLVREELVDPRQRFRDFGRRRTRHKGLGEVKLGTAGNGGPRPRRRAMRYERTLRLLRPYMPSPLYFPTSGTKRTGAISISSSLSPRRVYMKSVCSSLSPIGIKIRPPSVNCSW